jgi:hypothetical protein
MEYGDIDHLLIACLEVVIVFAQPAVLPNHATEGALIDPLGIRHLFIARRRR